jgi:hypothetical protein
LLIRNDQGPEVRDAELENLLGNLLIAEYQVDRLRNRLAEKVQGRGGDSGANSQSVYTFKNRDKLLRVRIQIDEMELSTITAKDAGL